MIQFLDGARTRYSLIDIKAGGKKVDAVSGEPTSAVLLAIGDKAFRLTSEATRTKMGLLRSQAVFGLPRSVRGAPNARVCVTRVESGMRLETQRDPTVPGERRQCFSFVRTARRGIIFVRTLCLAACSSWWSSGSYELHNGHVLSRTGPRWIPRRTSGYCCRSDSARGAPETNR